MTSVNDVKNALRKKTAISKPPRLLSTGSTLLNLACAGDPSGGFAQGTYVYFVGDSSSGKTWICLNCLAEASIRKSFNNFRLIFDNGENGALMDVQRYYGTALKDRLEPPRVDKEGNPLYSVTVEDFYDNLDAATGGYLSNPRTYKKMPPFIYLLDSMDCLTAEDDTKKFAKKKSARQGATKTDVAGSYGTAKAKINSSNLPRVMSFLRREGKSIVIIISQTRDLIGGFGFGAEKSTRGGGRALTFYASMEMWTSVQEKIKKTVRGKPRQIGAVCKVKVKKTRVTGKDKTIQVPIYHSFGVDDIGSCITYLLDENHWKISKGDADSSGKKEWKSYVKTQSFNAPEFDFHGTVEQLVAKVEAEGLEAQLRSLVSAVWDDIEEDCAIKRKPRYV